MRSRNLSKAPMNVAAAAFAARFASGAPAPEEAKAKAKDAKEPATATATLESRAGSAVTGMATFTEVAGGGVKIHVHVENAAPGSHGLHVHEKGDCSSPDATSAGGHFNPTGIPHAAPTADKHHAGDFGNIEVGADGKGDLDITSDMLTVKAGPNSVVGRAVVFHEKTDDLTTQPTGNAGGRFACGVVK